MADRLTNALEAQRAFVANASHQLRTPLTGLRLRIEAADMATDDPAVREQLAAADAETVRLARLVSNLLRLASADAPAPPSEPVDLAAAAREAQARWSGRAQQEGRHVACAPDEPATAVGNSDDLATSLDNLIENALEHSPSGGNVTITWGAAGDEAFIAVLDEVPASHRRMPPWRSSASSAAPPGPSGAAEPGSASRSSERSPSAGAAPPRCAPATKVVRAPRYACLRTPWRTTQALPSPYPRSPSLICRCVRG